MKSDLLYGQIISIYRTHLMYDSFSKKMQMSHMDLKIQKVKESYLKIVEGELKELQTKFK